MNFPGRLSPVPGPASGAALFGKIPAKPDFVRERCGDRAAQRFDQWLVKAIETMQSARASLPPVMVRYAFCAEEERTWVLGVLSPSKDQVGRDFPVSVFCRVPVSEGDDQLPSLPLAGDAFLDAAEALIREVPALRAEEVTAQLDQLQPPDAASLGVASARIAQALRESDAREFAERTLGSADGSGPAYGYYTFVTAARNAAAGSATVLDCPIQIDVDLFAWLALAERLLSGRGIARSFFWTEEPTARLLLAFGSCSPQILHFLSDPAHSSARLWPLVTSRSEVAEQVRASFAPNMPSLERGGNASIDQLIEGLRRSAP